MVLDRVRKHQKSVFSMLRDRLNIMLLMCLFIVAGTSIAHAQQPLPSVLKVDSLPVKADSLLLGTDSMALATDSLIQMMDSLAKEVSKPAPIVDSTLLQCYVVDSQTGDSIPYANAIYRTLKVGASSDADGHFTIEKKAGEQLTVTAVGYKPRRIKVTDDTPNTLHITLIADSKQLQGVVVKAKRRHRYSRKDNPAVELMKRVIAAKKESLLSNHSYYQYDKYQKVTMAINNLTPDDIEGKMFKNFNKDGIGSSEATHLS